MANLGIDLGTSNTIVSYYDGQLRVCKFGAGKDRVPSFVYVKPDGKYVVGEAAKNFWKDKTTVNSVFYKYKLKMGSSYLFGDKFSPEELTAMVLKYIKMTVVSSARHKTPIKDIESVVVTVPHSWSDPQIDATRRAVHLAELPLGRILKEPVAAAAYWTFMSDEEEGQRNILVCDMGGGTFDVSLCRVTPKKKVEVIDNISNSRAGDNVDYHIGLKMVEAITGIKYASLYEFEFGRELLLKAEEFKIKLNDYIENGMDDYYSEQIRDKTDFTLTGDLLRECMKDVLENGQMIINKIMGRNRIQIDDVVLSGGMSKMSFVRDMIRDVTGLENKDFGIDSDLSISYGASLVAGGIIQIQDVLMYDIGMAMKTRTGKDEVKIMITKGENLPTDVFTTRNWFFDFYDIRDWKAILISLRERSTPDRKRIFNMLTPQVQKIIEEWNPHDTITETHQLSLLGGLNAIIERKDLWKPEDFAGIKLHEKGMELYRKGVENLATGETERFNRYLLESIYPDQIERCLKPLTLRTKLPAVDDQTSRLYQEVVQTVSGMPEEILSRQKARFRIPVGTRKDTEFFYELFVDENGIMHINCISHETGTADKAQFLLESIEQELLLE